MATKPQTLATTSAFEILGPIMVGPSSSHTAGALRCAQVATALVEGNVSKVRFTLMNSFAHTYRGHGTDRALLAGIMGLNPDDERIRDAFALAQKRGLGYEFVTGGDDPNMHPNTVDIYMEDSSGQHVTVRGESLGGGKVRISRINGVGVDLTGAYATLFVSHRDEPGVLASLTSLLAEAQVNIASCKTYRTEQGGSAYSIFETDGSPATEILPLVRNLHAVTHAVFVSLPGAGSAAAGMSTQDVFDNSVQLIEACHKLDMSIGQVMELREGRITGAAWAKAAMERVLQTMRAETSEPIASVQRSLGGFIGGEARSVDDAAERLAPALMGTVQSKAVARALAVLERSAAMGVIVAAPTAGSAGVVPGCVLSVAEHLELGDAETAEALYCAAAVGVLLSAYACVAGAEGGCQAEVGSASAMAAAALVQMMGGTPEQAFDAASLAISNLLGLVCDPVGGLVEVPCQARNAIGVAAAFSSAQLALSGVGSLVPFDEMARVMLNVGHALPSALRETAQGGIASAPSARAAVAACASCNGCA